MSGVSGHPLDPVRIGREVRQIAYVESPSEKP